MDLNRRFAELVGWKMSLEHEASYREAFRDNGEPENTPLPVPDFVADPRLVLREINPCDAESFINYVLDHSELEQPTPMDYCLYLCDLFKDTTGLLVKAAIEFLERGKRDEEKT